MKRALNACAVLWATASSAAESPDAGAGAEPADTPNQVQAAMEHAGHGPRAWFPPNWQAPSLFGLERWQWLGIPLLLVAVAATTWLLVRVTGAVFRRLTRGRGLGAEIVGRVAGPLKLWWTALLLRLSLPLLALSPAVEDGWQRVFGVGLGVASFWAALRAVTAGSDHFARSEFASLRPGSRALVNLFTGVARFALVGLAVLAVLSALGYSVTSVLAGLGIGGIALALGAQKTLENVFGAFALAVDQPIREGDFVRVDDVLGTVENIGLRSTRIRTVERTVVSSPNGKLADMRLETFAARDRTRLSVKLGVVYGTIPAGAPRSAQALAGRRISGLREPQ